jgi:S-disulfanyl-L-cysteine oxidoreductase SoxD
MRHALRSLVLALCLAAPPLLAGCTAPADDAGTRTTTRAAAPADLPERFGHGRPATAAEIAALAVTVTSDGTGLPPGRGSVTAGVHVYAAKCASCHGHRGEGVQGMGDRLVGTEPIDSTGWNRTIGNYWPYATTVFDYIRRAMPFDRPGSLTADEAYALTAYLLHLNEIIPADAVLDAGSLPQVVMPARHRFVRDDRETTTAVR